MSVETEENDVIEEEGAVDETEQDTTAAVEQEADPDPENEVPEDYEELSLPEKTGLNDDDMARIREEAKALGLTRKQAKLKLEQENTRAAKAAERQMEVFKKQTEDWADEVKADKELGGKNFAETERLTGLAVQKFATDELKELLNTTGFGNNIHVVKFFAEVGKAMDESELVHAQKQSDEPQSLADRMYPNEAKRQN